MFKIKCSLCLIILCINSPLFAASISVGSGSFVDFGGAQISSANLSFENSGEVDFGTSQIVLTDFSNQASALVDAASAVLSISGNWFNVGEFRAMSSMVEFIDGTTSTSAISGQTTFNDLIVASATGKVLQFESGSQQSIENHLELTGVSGSLLTLVSSIDGDEAFLNLSRNGTQLIDFVDVTDNYATGQVIAPGLAGDYNSVQGSNVRGWFGVPLEMPVPTLGFLGQILLAASLFLIILFNQKKLIKLRGLS